MRLNVVILCVLAVLGSIFLVCSRSDVISGVADGVVSDMDPTLTDTLKRFVWIDLDSSDVDSSYSLPAGADPAFSTTFDNCVIGVNGQGDTLAAYVQYNVGADTSRYKGDTLKLEGVYLYFRAADSIGLSDTISFYWVNKLPESAPVSRGGDNKHPDADKDVFTEPCLPDTDDGESGDTAGDDGDDGACAAITKEVWPLKFTIGGDNGIDSVRLPDSVAKKIFGARASSDSTGESVFAFSMYYGKKELRGIQNPNMVIVSYRVEEPDSGKDVGDTLTFFRDTIRAGASRFTAFENADSVASRAEKAYTSRRTLRTAVFDISLNKIISKTGKQGEYTNMNAVVTLKPGRDLGDSASSYRIFISDARFKGSDAASLNENFRKNSSVMKPVQPYNTLSINTSLQGFLDGKKEYLYIYLRAEPDGGVIIWDEPEPIRIETVFTPSR